jgi:hypothetical protein
MILRRVMQHVRDQNWFAVGIDFVIVVVGVVIGIQVANWNEARKERAAEHRYLVELARDLEADIAEFQRGRRHTLARLSTSEAILQAIDPAYRRPAFFPQVTEEPVPNPTFSGYAHAALTATFTVIGTDYTFNELVQSGNLGVLSDRALVNQLAAYYGKIKLRRQEDQVAFQQVAPMLGYLRERGLGLGDPTTVEDAVQLAREDAHFRGMVKAASFLGLWQYGQLLPLLSDAHAALAAVQAQVEAQAGGTR